jgi:hypothetical protein
MYLKFRITYVLMALLIMATVSASSGSAPAAYKIRGVVINMESGGPVKLAEVFISGSTFGSITNEAGEFELETSYLPCQLVVSHISYAPFNKMIDAESLTYLTVKLSPYPHEITEITIASTSRRKDNLELFKKGFLGTDDIAKSCTILNDSVITFMWDSLVFSASSNQPIQVDNPKLGYKINIILDNFKLIYTPETYKRIHKARKIKPDVTDAIYQIACHFHYKPYTPGKQREENRIVKNRRRIYYGSKMHFLRALYSGKLKTHGYEINPGSKWIPVTYSGIMNTSSGINILFLDQEGLPEKMLVYPEKPMQISFFEDQFGNPVDLNMDSGFNLDPRQSMIRFVNKRCTVRKNGTTLDYSMIFSGHMGDQRISSMLPDDYEPQD